MGRMNELASKNDEVVSSYISKYLYIWRREDIPETKLTSDLIEIENGFEPRL